MCGGGGGVQTMIFSDPRVSHFVAPLPVITDGPLKPQGQVASMGVVPAHKRIQGLQLGVPHAITSI